jgi:hypothetical protein
MAADGTEYKLSDKESDTMMACPCSLPIFAHETVTSENRNPSSRQFNEV